jgi:cytochrome c biogenesis protein CcmG, thiol:disulfide interchange protein DsbE
MRAILGPAGVCALAIAAVVAGCGSQQAHVRAPSPTQAARALTGSPPALASLHRQAGELLGGGETAFAARLATLRGHPVIVNKWASWCGPCTYEFPFFQRASVRFGRRVAFVGVDGGDTSDHARAFLRTRWLSYPSYEDPHEQIARTIEAPNNYPITVYLDRAGKVAYVHQGEYRDEAALVADVERYALRS